MLLFSQQVISDTLQPYGLQHSRLPCPIPSPRVCPSSCPLNQWSYPTMSSSVTLFSFCLQSFPASRSFPVSQLFAWGGQSIGDSASASVLQWVFMVAFLYSGLIDWFDLLTVQETQESSPTLQLASINSLALSLLYGSAFTSVHDYWKDHSPDYIDLRQQSVVFAF